MIEILGRTGAYGEINQCLCKVLEGPEAGRVKRRNVRGIVRVHDVIILLSTEREAKEIRAR